jgi:hypothetical protein
VLLLFSSLSLAFEPVIEEVGGGQIDWSELRLEVTVTSQQTTGAWQDRRLQEQDAHDRLSSIIDDIASGIEVMPGVTADALMSQGDALGDRLTEGLKRWGVEEARYHHSGGVALDGSLDLRAWLAPALVEQARAADAPIEGEATGLLIDARGHDAPLVLAPELTTPAGVRLVHAGALSEDTARMRTPVIYVRDPADPRAAARAGDSPLFGHVGEVRDGVLILDGASAAQLTASPDLPALVAAGRVVIVVDP